MGSDERRHLTGPEFESLLESSIPGVTRDELETHLKICAPCSRQMERYKAESLILKELQFRGEAQPGVDCPEREEWLRLAVGLQDKDAAAALLEHAAGCDACGLLLKNAVEDLNLSDVPEPVGQANPEFAKKLAANLHELHLRERGPALPFYRRRPVRLVALSALAAAAALVLVTRPAWLFGASAERMLAKAYESDRTWPVRFPDASYVPMANVTRSASSLNTPLADAEAAVSRGLDRQPNSAEWLELRGRVEFLRRRYDSAIATLRPLSEGDHSEPALADLGAAYLARGVAAVNAADEENAVEYLSRALQRSPNNQVALFNRALALEALFLWDRAAQDWNDYLRLDPKGGWAGEAREHLDSIAKKKASGAVN